MLRIHFFFLLCICCRGFELLHNDDIDADFDDFRPSAPSPLRLDDEIALESLNDPFGSQKTVDEQIFHTRSQILNFLADDATGSPVASLPPNPNEFNNSAGPFKDINVADLYLGFQTTLGLQIEYSGQTTRQIFKCSAFFVAPTRILTAGHCVERCVVRRHRRWVACRLAADVQESEKLILAALSVITSSRFVTDSGYAINLSDVVRPGESLDIRWYNQRDAAVIKTDSYIFAPSVVLPFLGVTKIAEVVGKTDELSFIVFGFPPRLGDDADIQVKGGTVKGMIVNAWFLGGSRKLMTIGTDGKIDILKHTLFYVNPTYNGFSGGLVALVHNGRLYSVGIHVGAEYENVAVSVGHPFVLGNLGDGAKTEL